MLSRFGVLKTLSEENRIISKFSGIAIGSVALLFAIIAVATEGWWASDNATHGLWTADGQAIFIGQDIGYKVFSTVIWEDF